MRQKRAKTYRKLMSSYCQSFGFRQPYQVLVDSEICRLAVEAKTDLQKQLGTVLQGTVKPSTRIDCPRCSKGKSQQPVVDLAKSFERRKCNHREAIPGDDCLASVVGDSNKHRYVIATQSHPLRLKLRLIPAVPIVHVNRAVMILEPPSDVTLKVKQQNEETTLGPSATELATIRSSHTRSDPPRKKKGPKGPNPLSMKKKAVPRARPPRPTGEPSNEPSDLDADAGRKRKHTDGEDAPAASAGRKHKRHKKHGNTNETTEPLISDVQ